MTFHSALAQISPYRRVSGLNASPPGCQTRMDRLIANCVLDDRHPPQRIHHSLPRLQALPYLQPSVFLGFMPNIFVSASASLAWMVRLTCEACSAFRRMGHAR